jgi:type IV secretion system protein VirB5
MKPALALALAGLIAASATPASAQTIVHDPTNYASLIRQAQTALDELNELRNQVAEAKRLYDGFNTASGAGRLAPLLSDPALRRFVPDLDTYVAAANGDFSRLGSIGQAASVLRSAERLFTPAPGDALGQDLERAGDRAARDVALGQAAAKSGGERLAGLQQLLDALDGAPNARAVMDLQARISAEQALTANDQMRLQGLAMAQEAEARMQTQRDRERAMAGAQSRLALFRRGFQ